MTEKRALAILRAAERMGQMALKWMPYSDEVDESRRVDLDTDGILLRHDLEFIRQALKEVEFALLNLAEHEGSKGLRPR